MQCRPNCGACCIAPSISSPLPNMPNGKPAGVPCVNLHPETFECSVWNHTDYPNVCRSFTAMRDVCGEDREGAIDLILLWENQTQPQQ